MAVSVEIRDSQRVRFGSSAEVERSLECAIAFPPQDRNCPGKICGNAVGYNQIKFAITIEITCRQGDRTSAAGVIDSAWEQAMAVPRQDRDTVGKAVGHSHVERAFAVEIGKGDGFRRRAGFEADGGL